METKSINKYCKGCRTYDELTDGCGSVSAAVVNPIGMCPCTYCLVKPICNHECDDYSNYIMGERDT